MSFNYQNNEIAEGIYCLGLNVVIGGLQCNSYLIVDGDEAVLIDPGSVLDFDEVFKQVSAIIPIYKLKYIVLSHQDPDLCSSIPLFERAGAVFLIVTHWRTQTIVKYYGIKSDYYIVNDHYFNLILKSGRKLIFVRTPYLHSAGAIATYDEKTKILFSSDLFGAFSQKWSLYADENYLEKMKPFHEHYMPSNDILKPIMEILLYMNILQIAPQHGSVINNNIRMYIECLRDLQCGTFLNSIKKDFIEYGGYTSLLNQVINKLKDIYGMDIVMNSIKELNINFDITTNQIIDYDYSGEQLWELLFQTFAVNNGIRWLMVVEPFIRLLASTYNINIPKVFDTMLDKFEENVANLSIQNEELINSLDQLNLKVQVAEDKVLKCNITGLYNDIFFRQYLKNEVEKLSAESEKQNAFLLVIAIDNMSNIKRDLGDSGVNEVLKVMPYIIKNNSNENYFLFRLPGAYFALYLPNESEGNSLALAEKIRNDIAESDLFIKKITVSIGIAGLGEILTSSGNDSNIDESWYELAMARVNLAKQNGMNLVCSSSSVNDTMAKGKILIIDNDHDNIYLLKTYLENNNYRVIVSVDGEDALQKIDSENPDLIISEIMILKINGFLIRETLLKSSYTKNIPFFICSHIKNEETVQRAISLGIVHYFKKPYMLVELLGIIQNSVRGDNF